MKQANTIKLSDRVTVASRFGRSVNLERDFYARSALDGFVLTTTGRAALYRFAEALADENAVRAWTLTGPFGSGKSAFALFLAKAAGCSQTADVGAAREILKRADENLWRKLFDKKRKSSVGKNGLLPILVSGSRESLATALLRGLRATLGNYEEFNSLFFHSQIETLISEGENANTRQIVELFTEVSKQAVASGKANGLLIVVDELGKLLEHAAAKRDGDVFLLQELAEAAKNVGESPMFLLTILHQSFDNYIERLGRSRQEEWAKIQSRFEDIAFLEPTEQILRLVSQAIETDAYQSAGQRLALKTVKLGLADSLKKEDAEAILGGCLPLHPTVALIVGQLFRRVAQNERSLFAFLTSNEPFGFQDFLDRRDFSEKSPPLYRLDNLYDYIMTALGGSLYAQANGGRKWAEIETVLNRMNSGGGIEIRLIKAIGLLQVVGDLGNLKSSPEVLTFAFDDERSGAVNDALENLKNRSLIIYRHYNRAFGLWEGSDIDLDERVREARRHVNPNESLAEDLTKHFKLKPTVAKRHSLQTGTLRFFDARYATAADFDEQIGEPLGDADGRILYAIALNDEEIKSLVEKAQNKNLRGAKQILIAVPPQVTNLREAVYEVACLRWTQANTPELASDRVANRELQARLAKAEARVQTWLETLNGASSETDSAENCLWFHQAKRIEITSPRELQERLSKICDEVFKNAPALHNEIINRRELSGTAKSARKSLIEAMLAHADKPNLAIEGFPPQMSVYFSIFQQTGMHRAEKGRWGFYAPGENADDGIKAVWNEIDLFLSETEVERQTAADLFRRLSQPPFGLKSGVLPVLLVAALLYYDTEVALYEQGSFVPSLSMPVFERLVKSPETFQMQRCRIAGVRALVFERFAEVLEIKSKNKKTSLLEIVRGLTRFAASLPEYTRRTQSVSPNAVRVRRVLFETREPDKMLFEQLPAACGFAEGFTNEKTKKPAKVDEFFRALRESLAELQRKYDDLLGELERMLIHAFALEGAGAEARGEIETRAFRLLELTVEPKLKGFIIRLVNQDLDLSRWVESIAAFLADKTPDLWNDTDLARYEINLAELRRSFLHIEALAFEMRKYEFDPRKEIIRLGVTIVNEPERQKILTINEEEKIKIEAAKQAVAKAFESVSMNDNLELRLAVLAKLSQELLDDLKNSEKQNKASA